MLQVEDGVTEGLSNRCRKCSYIKLLVSVFPTSLSLPPEPSEPARQLIFYNDKARSMQAELLHSLECIKHNNGWTREAHKAK